MKDIIYAGFAQLSYLDWHKLTLVPSGTKLKDIFKEGSIAFNQILTEDYIKMYGGTKSDSSEGVIKGKGYTINKPQKKESVIKLEKDYLRLENKKKIYHEKDARLFYLYSEHKEEPNKNPKYFEFGEWEFLEGYDHKKIYDEMPEYMDTTIWQNSAGTKQYKKEKKKEIEERDSGFQVSIFKNTEDRVIMIAYRGTDELSKDFPYANIPSGADRVTDQMSCAIYVYNEIKSKYGKSYKMHITGHSLGGSLAQYVAVYANAKVPTVCWNGLGLGNENIKTDNSRKEIHADVFKYNYENCLENKNIKNYSFSMDFVGNLFKKVGDTFIVDKETSNVRNREMYMHSIFNFLPFFDLNGNINRDRKLSNNFLMNSFKQFAQEKKDVLPKIKKGQSGIKMGEMYEYIINGHDYKNNLWHCIERSFSKDDTRWYDPSVPSIGLFNNISSIAGVTGGEPMKLASPLASAVKTAQVIELQNGNWYIKSNQV